MKTSNYKYAVFPILDHAQYLCCFNKFALKLPIAKEQLELTRDSVKERIKEAINKTEKVEPSVEKWVKDVEKVLEEVKMLEERISSVSKSYFRRQCKYSLVKEIETKTTEMIQLVCNSKFEPFSKITELPGMKYYSSDDFFMFNSTEASYNKLLEELKNKSVFMIGLVGLGGSGKTTLAKEVGKKVEEMRIFEKVVFATVSQPLNIRSIQDQIVDQLGFKLMEESDIGRAQRLSERLRKGTTLVILDDVWEKINFQALGIPLDASNKTCCIFITTRTREVCTFMQCQSIVELNLLSDEEAWTLFRNYANITDDSSEGLKGVARKIVNECKGLPIAIVTVGSTLKDKTIANFELALSRLENSKPLDVTKGFTSPYVCLELSYNNLTNPLAQSLLLLCSMFPEDCEIDLEDLFRFGRGFDRIGRFGTMENARREMDEAIDMLKNCFLLMHVKEKKRVKMHDLVRDVALWIASKSGQAIFTRTEVDPKELADDEVMKDMKAIVVWGLNSYHLLNYKINCQILEILLLSFNVSGGVKVLDGCLQSLEKLKTLAIINLAEWNKGPLPLQESLKSLKNIRTLCLRGHDLGDISFVERLQALEILDLRGSYFDDLPVGMVELMKLKLLDLYKCVIKKNKNVEAYEVVKKCLQLEELYLCLIEYEKAFPHDVPFSRLQRYVIMSGYFFSHKHHFCRGDLMIMKKYAQSRSLLIDGFDVGAQNFISSPIKDLFIRAEYLNLRNLEGDYKNIIPSMDPQGMNELIALSLKYCSKIECLIDSTINSNTSFGLLQTEVVFSTLVYLSLVGLDNLREVFCDPSSRCSLKNLQELEIERCYKLISVSFPMRSKLCNLKVLTISECPMLTSLFTPSVVQTLELLEVLQIDECNSLRHIIEEENDVLPSTQKKVMTVSDIQQHKTPTENDILWLISNTLKQLEDDPLSNPQLKVFLKFRSLWLSDLRIKGIFKFQMGEEGGTTQPLPLNLDMTWLKLLNLAELNFIWKGPTAFLSFQNLRYITVKECPKLITIFSSTVVTSLPQLTYLDISTCDELEQIFDLGDGQQLKTLSSTQQLCFPTLSSITLEHCHKLKYIFYNLSVSHFTSVKKLVIKNCSQLHKAFGFEHEADDDGLEEMGKDGKQLLLHNLKDITLLFLPNFQEIHHGFKLKEDVKQIIAECPKYSPSLYLHPGDT
ncbi:disease resistance protein RPS2 [Vigna unguiculata]|uniref:Disease resistance protein RPS2 n=1 Tax=Vigna unguiculata TaxID=3917 RepID=A0A4D6MHV8_VIGUN|nr:disease resistance protein RPS2 [Vigna unguiculata]